MRRSVSPAILVALLSTACARTGEGPAPTPSPPRAATPVAAPPPERAPDAPEELKIAALRPGATGLARVRGSVATVVGMRLVPPKVVFRLADGSGSVLVVINEQLQLSEGTKLELVGKYREMDSPMHSDPTPAPKEMVFEVERYLQLSD
ncbi:MAG: hypothetical protein IT371_18355 [Deltaproteobacteria bacterium]|nr:hypothetical protein [Deltaproteobacteria bacterium]